MNEIKSLDDLIEKKYKIITTIGVFGALTLFSINLGNYWITFGSLALFLILCWELYKNIPEITGTEIIFTSLNLFRILFFVGFLGPIYIYVAKFAFVLHPEIKWSFIIFFIVAPILNFQFLIYNNWKKTPELLLFTNQKRKFFYWNISVVILFFVIGIELSYLMIKFFEIALK
jgi:hypothetical protein